MVSKALFVVVALCICQAIAKPSADKQDNLQQLANQVQGVFETFTDEFKKVFDIKETADSKKVTEHLKTNANEFAGKLSEILGEVNKEAKAHSGDVNKAVEALKTKVSETVKTIQEAHPTEAAKAQEYQKQIEQAYVDLYGKAKEAAQAIAKDTSGVQEDVHKFTENVIEAIKNGMNSVNVELKKTLDEHKSKH